MAMLLDHNNSCDGGILLSLDSHKPVPAPFLTKTYQLVDDPATDHIVSWGEDDSTFVVWRPPEFARDLLPNYFKHNNFSSFVRQLNTYGFRKIVPDRWEFANEYFKKGEKNLLCEIHRRKTSQPQLPLHHHHHQHHFTGGIGGGGNGYFPYPTIRSISPPDEYSEDGHLYSDNHSPSLCSPTTTASATTAGGMLGVAFQNNNNVRNGNNSVTALSEDNERLRRSNNMLMSELQHMRKLYNDIIYFVQHHVKPVAPSNTTTYMNNNGGQLLMQKQPQQTAAAGSYNYHNVGNNNNPIIISNNNNNNNNVNVVGIGIESGTDNVNVARTKLFGVPLLSKKRLHPEYGSNNNNNNNNSATTTTLMVENHKARLVLENDDLGLNLMPPSPC